MATYEVEGQPTTLVNLGVSDLTSRQIEVLDLAARGFSGKQIARRLGLSVRTVEGHFSRMRQRTGSRSTGELIACALTAGIVILGPSDRPRRGRPDITSLGCSRSAMKRVLPRAGGR